MSTFGLSQSGHLADEGEIISSNNIYLVGMKVAMQIGLILFFVLGLFGQVHAQFAKTTINRPCDSCEPRAVEAADFNKDGIPDLVVSDNARQEIHLYVGTGSGSGTDLLEPKSVLSTVSAAEAFASGDFDDDGNRDLVVATGAEILVFFGNGDGTFQSSTKIGLAISRDVVVADFDNENGLDIATTDTFSDELIVFFNDGTGGFGSSSTFATAGSLQSITVGDIGGDSDMDIVGASTDDNLVQLFENDGQGSFSSSQVDKNLPKASLVVATSVDANSDSNLDLVAYSNNSQSGVPTLLWYPGNGDGTFGSPQAISSESLRLFKLLTLDIGSNGLTDLVAVGGKTDTRVLISDGQGGFSSESITGFELGFGGDLLRKGGAAVADLNDDGNLDFVGTAVTMDAVQLRTGDGTGAFTPNTLVMPPDIQVDPQGNQNIATGDVNGNGETDVVLGTASSTSELVWYSNNGSGSFGDKSVVDPRIVEEVKVIDFDGDTAMDILAADLNDGLEMYEWNGDGGFTSTTLISSSITSFEVGDVDGNGQPDVVFGGSKGLSVALNNGDGTFSTSTISGSVGSVSDIDIAEVTQDEHPDVLYADNNDRKVVYYPGNGDGTFRNEQIITSGDFGRRVIVRDLDGDDLPDVVASLVDGDVGVFINSGSGSFIQDDTYSGATSPLALPHLSADDAPDLLQGNKWRKNNGTGGFGSQTEYDSKVSDPVSIYLAAVSYGEIDQNLSVDPVTLDSGTDALAWYENDLSSVVASQSATVSSSGTVDFGDTGTDIDFSVSGGSGEVTVSKYGSRPVSTESITESTVSRYRFVIEAEGDLNLDSNTEVRLDVSTLEGIDDVTTSGGEANNVTIYKRSTEGSGEFDALTTTYDSGNDELVASTNSFSEFVLASNSEPLPVEMASFNARTNEESVRLLWKTASETNNAGFRVQRRAGEEDAWQKVGFVESKVEGGTTNESQSYRFTDADLPYEADRLTYRLKQVDTDGSTSLTDPTVVERGVTEVQLLNTFPNPAGQQATVRYALPDKQEVAVRLYDALGRKVETVIDDRQEGRREQTIDVSSLSSGVYYLRLRTKGETRTQKVTVVR